MARTTLISLDDELADFVDRQMATEGYGSASEVVRAGLRFLAAHAKTVDELRAALIEGEDSGAALTVDCSSFARPLSSRLGLVSELASVNEYAVMPCAALDLDGAWAGMAELAGPERADQCLKRIARLCAALARGVRRGRSIEHVRAGYFRDFIDTYVIYYHWNGERRLEIVRIVKAWTSLGRYIHHAP